MEWIDDKPLKKPILLKIAPDLTNEELKDIVETIKELKIDGVVATNTTIGRKGLNTPTEILQKIGEGGLSGKPLARRSTEIIQLLRKSLGNEFPIIGVGGIHSVDDAIEKLHAGASLIELYTGFIYEGPGLLKKIKKALLKLE
jgi:dihydroorotate dehydrogenase